jgi:hypothetical protein
MPIPEQPTAHYLKDALDIVIDSVAGKKEALTQSDINKVAVAAQIQEGIERYRMDAAKKTSNELYEEEHNSKRLGNHLVERYGKRPARCHAHAIVAGKHKAAASLRLIMASLKIGIDDVDNGCWLPENTAATPHPAFPKAPPHSRIHRHNYYLWIFSRLQAIRDNGRFRTNLNIIARMMHNGDMPQHVMLSKGASAPTIGKNK